MAKPISIGLGAGVNVPTTGFNLNFVTTASRVVLKNKDVTNSIYVVLNARVGDWPTPGDPASGAFAPAIGKLGTNPTDLTLSNMTAAAVVNHGYKLDPGESREFIGFAAFNGAAQIACIAVVSDGGTPLLTGGQNDISN